MFRFGKTSFSVVNFHGYAFGKKGMRSKIELMENLRGKKGLSKRKTNILGGNFNFVEHPRDRKIGGEETFAKEKNIRDYFSILSTNFSIQVNIKV